MSTWLIYTLSIIYMSIVNIDSFNQCIYIVNLSFSIILIFTVDTIDTNII